MAFARTTGYIKAHAGLRALNRRTISLLDQPYDLIAAVLNYCGGFLGPIQDIDELAHLVADVRALNPRIIVEIGTHRGGTLYLWSRLAQPKATLISIDLRGGAFGGGYSAFRIPFYKRFSRDGQKLHLIRADSHAPSTLHMAKQLLNDQPIDLLFVDGDHTYDGVKKDWEMYSPLVRPSGLIVFHDVAGDYADTHVKSFWDTLKINYACREYISNPGGLYGIGVLQKAPLT